VIETIVNQQCIAAKLRITLIAADYPAHGVKTVNAQTKRKKQLIILRTE
jgi:hypothetical protein